MTKKTRLIILFILIILFFVTIPFIIMYSMGYRIDFETKKIVATGGIYVRAFPQGADVTIDGKIKNKTSFFSSATFVQNLLPKTHTVLIEKEGYHTYKKTLEVEERQVTKLENVTLFKQDLPFTLLGNEINYFSIAPDNNTLLAATIKQDTINFEIINIASKQKQTVSLAVKDISKRIDLAWAPDSKKAFLNIESNLFLLDLALPKNNITPINFSINVKEAFFNPQNTDQIFFIKGKNLYRDPKTPTLILENVASYQIVNQAIIWLSYDGFLYNSDLSGADTAKISLKAFPIKANNLYKITSASGAVFLYEDESVFSLNQKSKVFESFYSPARNLAVSPDGQKILYANDHELLYSLFGADDKKMTLYTSSDETIKDFYWVNSDYIIFTLESVAQSNIIISEIDNRGNINAITLPSTITLPDGTALTAQNSTIFFNQQDKKLYLLTQGSLIASERLLP